MIFERLFRALQVGLSLITEALKLETVGGEATVPPPGVPPLQLRIQGKVFELTARIKRVE